jgi:predicted nucleotidyltransferase
MMPTALELSREEWQSYIDAARKRSVPQLTPAEKQERRQLLSRVREVSAALKSRFGAQRVILFGSLANADWFTAGSDVDLAVEGLTGDRFWQAWRTAEEIIHDRSVDMIEIETARQSVLQAIHRYGIEL